MHCNKFSYITYDDYQPRLAYIRHFTVIAFLPLYLGAIQTIKASRYLEEKIID